MEYAIEAIKLGSTAVGIQTKQGVVLAVEKRLTSPLLEPSSVEKVGRGRVSGAIFVLSTAWFLLSFGAFVFGLGVFDRWGRMLMNWLILIGRFTDLF